MTRSFALLMLLCAVARADPAATPPVEPVEQTLDPAASAEVFVYAAHGQSDKQLDRDRYECHKWSVTQSGYNPSDPQLAPHQQIQVIAGPPPGREAAAGAISGAITGALIAGPHDTAEGALIGAFAGGALGALSESARKKEMQQVNAHNNAQAQAGRARLETQASNYRRAISACLEGRGYTVK